MTRTTSTGRTTMAEAEAGHDELNAVMPHLAYSDADLDNVHPPMLVNQDVCEDDEAQWNTWDGIAQRGEAIVRGEAGVALFRVAMRVCVCVMMKVGMCRRRCPAFCCNAVEQACPQCGIFSAHSSGFYQMVYGHSDYY